MTQAVINQFKALASVDFFAECIKSDQFIGRPFYLDFDTLRFVSNDKWKNMVGGVPSGAFVLAVYNDHSVPEALLLRVLNPTKLPTDNDIVMAMVDHYKENPRETTESRLDSYTRAEFQFSGLECRVIGTFYRDGAGVTKFAGDLDNFYAPHNYTVVKPTGQLLEYIVNFRDDGIPGGRDDRRIGRVRYSSSQRHSDEDEVPVYVAARDFLGKRTALFGMTRTGKSNTVKKIIQATADLELASSASNGTSKPVAPGQIIFDINGEYANSNQQDEGTAIYEQYPQRVTRYSVMEKPGFEVMKLNFLKSIAEGHGLLASLLADDTSNYTKAFCAIDWSQPDWSDGSARTRYQVKVAAYLACLHRAGYEDASIRVRFSSNQDIRQSGIKGLHGVKTDSGLSLEQTASWFETAWDNYSVSDGPFRKYRDEKGREWADEDTQNLMRFLTRKPKPGAAASESGYRKLTPHKNLHAASSGKPFEEDIVDRLRAGEIVIMDMSQGDPTVQRTYSDRVSRRIFADGMSRFIDNQSPNFIQMYFEEAHNLFPRRNETDLTLIYNRIAKEGQKLRIGLIYATQEVSSISASILKNTQNWFVSHLNNSDELRELDKYYDFVDFTASLRRTMDKGFIRLKTDSNTFIVPIQVDLFQVESSE